MMTMLFWPLIGALPARDGGAVVHHDDPFRPFAAAQRPFDRGGKRKFVADAR